MNTTRTLCAAGLVAVTGGLLSPVAQAQEPVTISGTVWRDANANGLRDPGEPGAPNVGMGVIMPNGSLADSGYTGPDGSYRFTGMPPDSYRVEMLVPEGQTLVRPNAGDDATDSDLNWINDASETVECSGGDCGVFDAGLVQRRMDLAVSASPHEIRLPVGSKAELKVVLRNTGNVPVLAPRVSGTFTTAGPGEGVGNGWTCGSKGEVYFCGQADLLEPGDATQELILPVTVPPRPDVVGVTSWVGGDVNPADNEVQVTVAPGGGR